MKKQKQQPRTTAQTLVQWLALCAKYQAGVPVWEAGRKQVQRNPNYWNQADVHELLDFVCTRASLSTLLKQGEQS